MKHHFKSLTLHVFLAAALVACGGGGGSSSGVTASNGDVPDDLSDIAWAVDAAAARQAVAGSEALTITLAQAAEQITAIQDNLGDPSAGGVLVSDILAYRGTGNLVRIPGTCSGLSCTFTFDGESATVNFGVPDPDAGTSESQLVMVHNGVKLGQTRRRDGKGTADQDEFIVYGGWLTYSAFEVGVFADPSFASSQVSAAMTLSYGDDTRSNPSESAGMTATWTGVMAGVDMSAANRENFIHGEAMATVDFVNSDMDLTFENLVDLNDADRNSALNGMNWTWENLSLTDGAFQSGSDTDQVEGQFYGPNHEEVGGTFERNQVLGAFVAKRQEQEDQ